MGATFNVTGEDVEQRARGLFVSAKGIVRSTLLELEKLPVACKKKPENMLLERRMRLALAVLCDPVEIPEAPQGEQLKNNWRKEMMANNFVDVSERVDDFMTENLESDLD